MNASKMKSKGTGKVKNPGSRGGKIVGYEKDGDPIYASSVKKKSDAHAQNALSDIRSITNSKTLVNAEALVRGKYGQSKPVDHLAMARAHKKLENDAIKSKDPQVFEDQARAHRALAEEHILIAKRKKRLRA